MKFLLCNKKLTIRNWSKSDLENGESEVCRIEVARKALTSSREKIQTRDKRGKE